MKKILLTVGVLSMFATAQAVVITAEDVLFSYNVDQNDNAIANSITTSSIGTWEYINGTTVKDKDDRKPYTFDVRLSGLTLDGTAGDDYITFTIQLTGLGDSAGNPGVFTERNVDYNVNGWRINNSNITRAGSELTWAISNVTANVGTIDSFGFTGGNAFVQNAGTSDATLLIGGESVSAGSVKPTLFGADFDATETMTFRVDANDGGAQFRFSTVDLEFNHTIPEPGTLGLVMGVGGAILIIRRRFSM